MTIRPSTMRLPLLATLTLALLALAANGPAAAQTPPPAATATITPTPSRTPTLPAWQPAGTWRVAHGAEHEPLWNRDEPRLHAVHGITDEARGPIAWAVGDECAVARYEGGAWRVDESAERLCDGLREYEIRDVFVRGPDELWAVGAYQGGPGRERDCVAATPESRDDVDYDEGCGMVLHHSAGTWRAFHFRDFGLNNPAPALNGLSMIRDEADEGWVGWAAGNNNEGDSISSIILEFVAGDERMEADGAWLLTGKSRTQIDEDFHAVKMVSPSEAWIVGEGGNESLYREPPAGSGIWAAAGISGVDHLYAVDLSDQLYGWSGGQRGRMNHYDGNCHDFDPATACWFDNQGRPVRHPSSPTMGLSNEIRAVHLLSRGIGWVAGRRFGNASFLAYLQPNRKWLAAEVENDPNQDLFGLHFADSGQGWAVGDNGTILEYVLPQPTATATAAASRTPTATVTATASATAVLAEPTETASASATAETPSATTTRTPAPSQTEPGPSATPGLGTPPPTSVGGQERHRIFLPFAWRRSGSR